MRGVHRSPDPHGPALCLYSRVGAVRAAQHWWTDCVRGTERARDVSDAVLTLIGGLVLLIVGLSGLWGPRPWVLDTWGAWVHLPPLVVGSAAMLTKRRRPVLALVVAVAVLVVDVWLGGSVGTVLVFFDVLYAAALYAGAVTVRRLRVVVALVIAATPVIAWFVFADLRLTAFASLQMFAIVSTPLWWGLAVRGQKELTQLAQDRAEDQRRLAQLREAEMLTEERARMARDLHDAIAGNLSAIAIHAEAALTLPVGEHGAGPRDRAALEAVRAASITSLGEMRSMIMLLRSGTEPAAAPARLCDLPDLLVAADGAGLDVRWVGPQVRNLPPLPSAVDQAAYRILQEALTNAAKHSGGGRVDVAVNLSAHRLELRIESHPAVDHPGTPRRAEPRAAAGIARGTGLGLLTMQERAEALGGRFAAGWQDAPGGPGLTRWSVVAELPCEPPP